MGDRRAAAAPRTPQGGQGRLSRGCLVLRGPSERPPGRRRSGPAQAGAGGGNERAAERAGGARGGAGPAGGRGWPSMAALRVLELYSGIGGMHQALRGTGASRGAPCCLPHPRHPALGASIFSRELLPLREAGGNAGYPSSRWGGQRWPFFSHSPFPSPACRHQVPRSTLGQKLGILAPSLALVAASGKAAILCFLLCALCNTDAPRLEMGWGSVRCPGCKPHEPGFPTGMHVKLVFRGHS